MVANSSAELKLQILDGTYRSSHLDPASSSHLPECHSFLDAVAKTNWNGLCTVLGEAGLLTRADRDLMAMYCAAFSQWREAAGMVKKSGLVIKGAGGVCANPCVAIAANAKREMRELSTVLGLDPASRSRLRVGIGAKTSASKGVGG